MGRFVQDHPGVARDQLIVGGDARSANRVREVKRILWAVLGLNLLVGFAKLLYGVITGSLGMQADGFHSLFDGLRRDLTLEDCGTIEPTLANWSIGLFDY